MNERAERSAAEDEDATLVGDAVAGSVTSFNRLVLRYQDATFTLCFRLTGNAEDAADASQEAFLAAFRHLSEYRGGSFKSWLFRIAANRCYDLHRTRQRRPEEPLGPSAESDFEDAPRPVEPADPGEGPEAAALRAELDRCIQAGLLELPEEQRLALVLCDLYQYDYQTIAALAEVELGTVKSRINRGRRRLRQYLLDHRELLPTAYRLRGEAGAPPQALT